ncbi:ABC-type transport auxiliary lipoprotein family protein [Nitrosomonas marina]|uniref:Cholesterol transport system auxiliary component n=1 Tax=Nitrosomonas marina TaxID=917 RepID=A0A1H8HER7_9PROT|nr:ABC-type transport auxiliary lipoprotein family protein [Nitrosomonas marina]SEN54580.1 cholesterol transport system auxiliary component [Nitrosomonas marina]
MRNLILFFSMLFVSGCTILPEASKDIATFNFAADDTDESGSSVLQSGGDGRKILVAPITAPLWLDTRGINYRLKYHNRSQSYTYANSRWSSPPAFLLTQQIKHKIATATRHLVIKDTSMAIAENELHVELEEFSQVFDTLNDSHVIIRFRASLVNNTHRLIAQKIFSIKQTAPTADAAGAVEAFSIASNKLVDALVEWLQAEIRTI